MRKFRVWYECVECELLIVSQTSERLFLFCSTFESETRQACLWNRLLLKTRSRSVPIVMRFCLCAYLENSPREKFLSWPSHLMAGKYAKQFESSFHWSLACSSSVCYSPSKWHRVFRLWVSACASRYFGVLTGVGCVGGVYTGKYDDFLSAAAKIFSAKHLFSCRLDYNVSGGICE